MSEILDELYDTTLDYAGRINEVDMEELLLLVDLRDRLLEQLVQDRLLSDEEKQRLSRIASCDRVIVARMEQLRNEASQGLQKLSSTKLQKQTYESVYASDSYFIDKRE